MTWYQNKEDLSEGKRIW